MSKLILPVLVFFGSLFVALQFPVPPGDITASATKIGVALAVAAFAAWLANFVVSRVVALLEYPHAFPKEFIVNAPIKDAVDALSPLFADVVTHARPTYDGGSSKRLSGCIKLSSGSWVFDAQGSGTFNNMYIEVYLKKIEDASTSVEMSFTPFLGEWKEMAPGLRRVILREQSYTPLVNLDARPQRAKTAGKMRSALKKAEQKYAKHHKQDEKETAVELPELGEKMSKQQREHCFALAENGDLEALFRVGWMYEHGMNVPRDQAKAAQYYERAAELGHTSAQYSLALLYSTGLGVERDERLFFHWCHAAAKSKDHAAEYRLGAYYYNGFDGANKTITLAEEWFRKSAKGGNADGQAALGLMLLNKEAFAGIGESARSWLLKAADENSALAQFWLGNMYEHGHGDEVAIDLEEAKGWYQLASANGNDEATSRLADLLPL